MSLRYSLHTSAEKTMTIADTPTPTISNSGHMSPWHSPVPYLFGGLAAMLGLIAFALLVLACSYWRLSGYLEGERDVEAGDESNGGDGPDDELKKVVQLPPPVFEEKFLVIMPGQQKPTCLATPMWSRASSFGSTSKSSSSSSCGATTASNETSLEQNNEDKILQENSVVQIDIGNSITMDPTHHI